MLRRIPLQRGVSLRTLASPLRGAPIFPTSILVVFIIMGVLGSVITPHDPTKMDLAVSLTPPFWQEGGTTKYLLGTDYLGRDELSRIIGGAAISLEVGFIVVFVAGVIGTFMALVSGYLGGWWDHVLMRIVDIKMSLPYLLIAIVLAGVLGPSKNNIIIILSILGWSGYARVMRSEVLRIKEADFIRLATVAGASKMRIMLVHIFPNTVNTLIILATLQLGGVILTESSLSFLGLGVPPPDPAWGSMLAEGRNYMTSAWWLAFWPGMTILLVVLASNLMGDWLRVRLDPKFRQV